MEALTDRDKRTLRIGAVVVVIYLIVFFGFQMVKKLESKRSEFQKLALSSAQLKDSLRPYENKALLLEKLRDTLKLDIRKYSKATLVAEASAAIQKASQTAGVQLGPVRESAARGSSRELATIQIEANGPVPGALSLLHQIEKLGFPMVIDTVQMSVEQNKPGMVKLTLGIVIFNFEQWKAEGGPNV